MASESKKTKSETTPKKDAPAKVESAGAEAASKDAPKPGDGETTGTAPANYSRGEGQKPVTAAYKENWNLIFAKKSAKRKKR